MAKELSRTLNCDGEQASEHLLNLSPFEMKNLLYHILSGKEFAISSGNNSIHLFFCLYYYFASLHNECHFSVYKVARGNFSIVSCASGRVSKKSQIGLIDPEAHDDVAITQIDDRQGQWLRRRRLDGALNRVPRDFYSRVWTVLERVSAVKVFILLCGINQTKSFNSISVSRLGDRRTSTTTKFDARDDTGRIEIRLGS